MFFKCVLLEVCSYFMAYQIFLVHLSFGINVKNNCNKLTDFAFYLNTIGASYFPTLKYNGHIRAIFCLILDVL